MSMKVNSRRWCGNWTGTASRSCAARCTSEIEGRRRQGSIKLEHIHPRMSADEERAAQEIARVIEDGDDA